MKNTTNFSSKLGVSKIFILVIIAVLVIGGIFVWQKWLKSDLRLKIKDSRLPKGIEVIEQRDKKIVRNKVEGYEAVVSKEWSIYGLKDYPESLKIQNFSEPKEATSGIGGEGCVIDVHIWDNPGHLSLQEWANQVSDCQNTIRDISISGVQGGWIEYYGCYGAGFPEVIIPVDNKMYEIHLSFSADKEQYCRDYFLKFLENFKLTK
jgi:hypothetical protein